MTRPLRILYPGAFYHITARGNRKGEIFLDDQDRQIFFTKLETIMKHHNWVCHAYCLMHNHYHLLIETIDASLSDGMRDLNKNYSQTFNRRHHTVGHLLQGRFKAFIIERDSYLLEVARYTVLNSVRAGLVDDPADWQWSSYRATAGLDKQPAFLAIDWILGQFGIERRSAQQAYAEFVYNGIDRQSPFVQAAHNSFLGSPQFVTEMWERSKESMFTKEISRAERFVGRLSLEELFPLGQSKKERNEMIVFARISCGYSVAEIARFLKLGRTQVSNLSR